MKSIFGPKRIYADWAATTPVHPKVARAMKRAEKAWANPSAIHAEGVMAKRMLDDARSLVARTLFVKPDEIFFTSGGTEANCTIIQGVITGCLKKGAKPKDVHVVSTSIEHSSVLETLKGFEERGVKVTYISPKENGIVSAEDVLAAVNKKTVFVTCMYANNEIGTIQPVSKIGAGIRKIRAEKFGKGEESAFPIFHTDASQAPMWLACDIEGVRADAMTLDAHKMQGPKGVGALIARHHVPFEPLMVGGGQERNKRPTTESVRLISGFAAALEIAQKERNEKSRRAEKVRDYFFKLIDTELPQAVVNGSRDKRLPNNVNISLPNLSDPELAVLKLDKEGIACSTKSSCLKGEEDSYVVKPLGGEAWRAKNTLRFTFAPDTTLKDMMRIIAVLRGLK